MKTLVLAVVLFVAPISLWAKQHPMTPFEIQSLAALKKQAPALQASVYLEPNLVPLKRYLDDALKQSQKGRWTVLETNRCAPEGAKHICALFVEHNPAGTASFVDVDTDFHFTYEVVTSADGSLKVTGPVKVWLFPDWEELIAE